jgi:uncharacterized iron-regulated membrane protein
MKKRLWKLHSWCGLIAGLGLLVIGLSGSILVFREEVDALLAPRSQQMVPPPRGTPRLSFDALFAKVRAQMPAQEIAAWSVSDRADEPDGLALVLRDDTETRWRWIKANPYTGEALGAKDATTRKFTEWLLDLHDSFLLGDWGLVVAGLFAALLCVLGLSGVWLYREFWSHFLRLRWRASARIYLSDLHKTVGISSVVFNLILGFTGAWWNLPSLSAALGFSQAEVKKPIPSRLYNTSLSVDALIDEARRALPGLRTDRVYLNFPPRWKDISVMGKVATRNPFRGAFGGEVTFDPETGALKKVTDIRQQPLWTQIEDTFAPLHFGTFGGLPIKLLWCLGGLAPGVLAVSGFLIRRSRLPPPSTVQ